MLGYVAYLSNNKHIEIKILQSHQNMTLIKAQHISVFQLNYDTGFSVTIQIFRT